MATGNTVKDGLPFDTSVITDGQIVNALNLAIAHAWPQFRLTEYEAGVVTLAAGDYDYSLAALTNLHRDLGVGVVYLVKDSDEPHVVRSDIRQIYDHSAGAWVLEVGSSLADTYSGKTLDVQYQYPHPTISAITDTIYLPLDYATYFVASWYAQRAMTKQYTERFMWRDLWEGWQAIWDRALARNRTPALPQSIRIGGERLI